MPNMFAPCPSPLKESNSLWLLAEASLNPTCGAADRDPTSGAVPTACDPTEEQLVIEPPAVKCSSRSSSPAIPGRSYVCRKCHREYASTDAVRKHCRQNHAEWLRERGQGCPTLYCTVVDAAPTPDGFAPAAVVDATPSAVLPACSLASEDPTTLFGAPESLVAFSKSFVESAATPVVATLAHLSATPTSSQPLVAARSVNKRPRSVRCGKCDGCERDDCGTCKNCVDKPKFGGTGQRKQGCVAKICKAVRLA